MGDIDTKSNVYRNGHAAGMRAASFYTGSALQALLADDLEEIPSPTGKVTYAKAWEDGVQQQREDEFYYSD